MLYVLQHIATVRLVLAHTVPLPLDLHRARDSDTLPIETVTYLLS